MRIIETKAYQYNELSPEAQERARDWYREASAGDNYFSESVIEHAADILGIDLRQRRVQLMGGGHRFEPSVYWSGFSSQGDGACFEGTWRARDMNVNELADVGDKELRRIADALNVIAATYPNASANIAQRGRYSHSGCMNVDCSDGIDLTDDGSDDERAAEFPADDITQLMRDFADWIYAQLKSEWEYVNSDEQVIESIVANEYEFDENGVLI